jgi:hypothetical protein
LIHFYKRFSDMMIPWLVIRFILLVTIFQFSVCDNYCGKDGVFGTEWKNECDDDEYYCCGVNEERCCTFDEFLDESGLEDATDWIVKIIVGIIVGSIVLGIVLILCCCCLPCCFFAKRRKRNAGAVRGQHMTVITQQGPNSQALLQNPNVNYPQQQSMPQSAVSYPPPGGVGTVPSYPPANQQAYPPANQQASHGWPGPGRHGPSGPTGYPDQPPPYSGPSAGYSSAPPGEPYPTKQPPYNPNALP